ncbi:c-type cytochrome [Paenibacillus sp. YAF4_2]|uniref:c-type cytochrome n=1 Tax=Paenibacillus sp. YAF4_2 TaxID=3233085 RepID=UPI003F996E69
MITKSIRAIALLVIASTITGCSSVSEQEQNAVSGTSDAETIYKQKCVSCHAIDLQGRVGPNLQKVGAKYTQEELLGIMSKGKGGMPSFEKRLSEEQIDALAVWLASKR